MHYIVALITVTVLGTHLGVTAFAPAAQANIIQQRCGSPTGACRLSSPLGSHLEAPTTRLLLRGPVAGCAMMAESTAGPAGPVSSYMKKIPSHLQGLAIRNQKGKKETVEYKVEMPSADGDEELTRQIEAEMAAEDEETFDFAMEVLENDEFDMRQYRGKLDQAQIDDAKVLRELQNQMNPEDFRKIFGRGVGELL